MNTKFTPGPWKTKRINTTGGSPGHSDFGSVVVIGKDEIIVKHHSMFYKVLVTKAPELGPHAVNTRRSYDDPGTPDYNESKCINGIHPDAHLIAAAPDLYEMLADALELATPDAWSQRQRKSQRWEERTRAALAKARGEAAR